MPELVKNRVPTLTFNECTNALKSIQGLASLRVNGFNEVIVFHNVPILAPNILHPTVHCSPCAQSNSDMPINKPTSNRNINSQHDLPHLPIQVISRSDSPASSYFVIGGKVTIYGDVDAQSDAIILLLDNKWKMNTQ